jgi:predicted nucleic acid-binding protein
LVDTSVLIDFLKGRKNFKAALFEKAIRLDVPFGIAAYTYQEILQGARDEQEFEKLKKYLSTQKIYFLPETNETYERAAKLRFNLRRKGITPGGTIDMLIALVAIIHKLLLLHNDGGYDSISEAYAELKILNNLQE